jgi:Aerotolerance regulator N-terminal
LDFGFVSDFGFRISNFTTIMTFAFPILLGGLLLVSIPVLLHLLLRQKPKTVLFPAFRFLVQRHRTNLTKLRLRHILLMALRMLLLAAIVLALAQPKVKDNPWSLPSDQAVAAIFVFDTSASMEYTVAANQSRIRDAQKRAVEMLKVFPENSEIVVLDSADSIPIGKGEWLSREKAAERIGQLRLQPSSGSVSTRVGVALELFGRVARTSDESHRNQRARVLGIFSDRTPASWDTRERRNLQSVANLVPPSFERLQAVHAGIPEQVKLLSELGQRLPAVHQSLPEQALVTALENLSERLSQLRIEDYPDTSTQPLLSAVRGKQQELLAFLEQDSSNMAPDAKEFHTRLMTALVHSLRSSAGFTAFYVDVGVDHPADLALAELQTIWELPASGFDDPKLKLQVEARATGEGFRPTLTCEIAGQMREYLLDVKAGKREFASFDIDSYLQTGFHQVKVTARPSDQLPLNNSRYLTYAIRRVLLVTDPEGMAGAKTWAKALEANRFGAALYKCEIKKARELGDGAPGMLDSYAAIFLWSLKAPDDNLWKALSDYAGRGGGVAVIPPAALDSNLEAYNKIQAAQDLLPAEIKEVIKVGDRGADWDWRGDIYKHPMMHPFQEWRQGTFDFFADPRGAFRYWLVQPRTGQVQVLVRYAESNASGRPALVERLIDLKRGRPGRVLQFTTPPGSADWNNYAADGSSFYVTLARQALGYLSGDADRPVLNFLCGQSVPQVPVPIASQAASYRLYRDGAAPPPVAVARVTVEAGQNEVSVPQAMEPGNYTLRVEDGEPLAWFSVNLPPEESDLNKVPKGEIEAVLGPETLLAIDAQADLSTVLSGHVSQPWEIMPILMLGLLFLLAAENLLANRFYRNKSEVRSPMSDVEKG